MDILKVLIVDDEKSIRNTLREILEFRDYEVEEAAEIHVACEFLPEFGQLLARLVADRGQRFELLVELVCVFLECRRLASDEIGRAGIVVHGREALLVQLEHLLGRGQVGARGLVERVHHDFLRLADFVECGLVLAGHGGLSSVR